MTELDDFLNDITGLIHVGANIGQEIPAYSLKNLSVLWIEPIPRYFVVLCNSLAGIPNQKAFQALITDLDDHLYDFYIASNSGGSSSILKMRLHVQVWPKIKYIEKMQIQSMTLTTFLRRAAIDVSEYQALVVDTQGSELLVLKGAQEVLHNFKYIKVEAADYEAYENCCTVDDIQEFFDANGFKKISTEIFREHYLGNYYDIVYERI